MIVLDTHSAIWYAAGKKLSRTALQRIDREAAANAVVLSAISAWEIGMLIGKGRLDPATGSPASYVAALFSGRGIVEQPVTAKIGELAARLPSDFHGDPADRIIVATAIDLGATLVTRDARILAYAKATSFVSVLGC